MAWGPVYVINNREELHVINGRPQSVLQNQFHPTAAPSADNKPPHIVAALQSIKNLPWIEIGFKFGLGVALASLALSVPLWIVLMVLGTLSK